MIETPFKRVAVDIDGPTEPRSERKSRYILTMINYATRYPEAVALPGIETERVAEALVEMLKQMLRRMCAERPKDWDVSALLCAIREVPQESLGFSPFELVYGRNV